MVVCGTLVAFVVILKRSCVVVPSVEKVVLHFVVASVDVLFLVEAVAVVEGSVTDFT